MNLSPHLILSFIFLACTTTLLASNERNDVTVSEYAPFSNEVAQEAPQSLYDQKMGEGEGVAPNHDEEESEGSFLEDAEYVIGALGTLALIVGGTACCRYRNAAVETRREEAQQRNRSEEQGGERSSPLQVTTKVEEKKQTKVQDTTSQPKTKTFEQKVQEIKNFSSSVDALRQRAERSRQNLFKGANGVRDCVGQRFVNDLSQNIDTILKGPLLLIQKANGIIPEWRQQVASDSQRIHRLADQKIETLKNSLVTTEARIEALIEQAQKRYDTVVHVFPVSNLPLQTTAQAIANDDQYIVMHAMNAVNLRHPITRYGQNEQDEQAYLKGWIKAQYDEVIALLKKNQKRYTHSSSTDLHQSTEPERAVDYFLSVLSSSKSELTRQQAEVLKGKK